MYSKKNALKTNINQLLNDDEPAELHFFWTTGYNNVLAGGAEYEPDMQINIGGSKYGKQFFTNMQELLDVSDEKLKIKLICDDLTIFSNQKQINKMEQEYKGNFEILNITDVVSNLKGVFAQDDQKGKIDAIFKNATHGLPVISSDIYRAIGMIYGQQRPSSKHYTYCDVDAFCQHMGKKEIEVNFIETLFKHREDTDFHFDRQATNNDIIKIALSSSNGDATYKKLCEQLIGNIEITPVVTYYVKLNEFVSKCATETICLNDIKEPYQMFNVVQDVMCATGPVFLWGHNISTDYLSYSSITEGDWKWGINDLNYESARQSATRPSYVLKYGRGKVANEQEVRGKFDDDCNDYRKHLAMYLYSKKFGDKHPLNIVLKQHLELSYPYKKDSFKKLLQANFESYQNILQKYEIKLVDNLDNIENSPHNIIYVSRFDHKNINLLVIHDQDSQSKLKLELIIKILSSGRLSPESVSAILAALKKENITIETTVPGLTELAWKEKVCAALKLDDRHFCVLNTLLDKAGIKFEDPEILSPDKQSSYGLNM